MRILTIAIAAGLALGAAQSGTAQQEPPLALGNEPASATPQTPVTPPTDFPHALAAKVLLVDYGIPDELSGRSVTNGIELAYLREVTSLLTLAAPLRMGVLNSFETVDAKQRFVSLDVAAQAGYPLFGERLTPYATAGLGVTAVTGGEGTMVQAPIGLGLRVRITDAAYLTGQYEFRKSFTAGRDNKQVGLGLIFNLGRGSFDAAYWDTDGDGVSDDEDACAESPGPKRQQGCPDSDGDGVSDHLDLCPHAAGPSADAGCPDADGDGVTDAKDECPDTPGLPARGGCPLPDADGDGFGDDVDPCPQLAGKLGGCPDADADGVVDDQDACPKQAGPRSTNGCPDRDNDGFADLRDNCPLMPGELNGCPDRDGDGVDDAADRCPNIAGERESEGCPAIMRADRQLFEYAVNAVPFAPGSTTIDAGAYEHLTGLADILERFPDFRVRVTGHADLLEPTTDRVALSRRRAEACAAYLESRGVSSGRIVVDGAGAGRPVVREGNSDQLARNRRVEFDLFE